ncbi:hypothetical protein [Xanthomonas arboricola]|uniref:hypothetical protein n=1 Tax=Xanthomonas arboricola TaxID=56448 RepID=UPI000AF7BC91|nr:hypothetical protein [Xanthomonas arboricola]MBB3848050.1 hypothetical protein [Xanthomonas arboricola]
MGVLMAVVSSMVEPFIHVVRILGCAHALVWVACSLCVGAQGGGMWPAQLGVLRFSDATQAQA